MYANYYVAEIEQRYRDGVLFPKAARNARHLRELELQDQALGRARRAPVAARYLGNALAIAGRLLVGAGELLAPGAKFRAAGQR